MAPVAWVGLASVYEMVETLEEFPEHQRNFCANRSCSANPANTKGRNQGRPL